MGIYLIEIECERDIDDCNTTTALTMTYENNNKTFASKKRLSLPKIKIKGTAERVSSKIENIRDAVLRHVPAKYIYLFGSYGSPVKVVGFE